MGNGKRVVHSKLDLETGFRVVERAFDSFRGLVTLHSPVLPGVVCRTSR